RSTRDWSSDVCSSDLRDLITPSSGVGGHVGGLDVDDCPCQGAPGYERARTLGNPATFRRPWPRRLSPKLKHEPAFWTIFFERDVERGSLPRNAGPVEDRTRPA